MGRLLSLSLSAVILLSQGCSSPARQTEFIPSERLGDIDRDGVINSRDMCPNTPLGALIDGVGCSDEDATSTKAEIVVIFEQNSAALSLAQQEAIVRSLAQEDESDFSHVTLEGHSSPEETESETTYLTQQRLISVRDFLVSLGIDSPIGVVTTGSRSKLFSAEQDHHHQLNQRVYIEIYYNGHQE